MAAPFVYLPADRGQVHDRVPVAVSTAAARYGAAVHVVDEPESGPLADARVRDALERVSSGETVVVGMSRGARVAVQAVSSTQPRALVLFSFPFHPRQDPGANERAAWLAACPVPVFLVQGTRDAMGNREQVRGYHLPSHITVRWMEQANHALVPRARSGLDPDIALRDACEDAVLWAQALR